SALLVSAALVVLAPRSPAQPDQAKLAQQAQAVLQKHCAQCHAGGNAKGGMGYILDRDKLVDRGQVILGKPAESALVQRLAAGEMPPVKQPRLQAHEIAALRAWIEH